MASLILGVTGKKRSGKDTFAQRLTSAHGFTRLAFADALKASILDLNPMVLVYADELGIVYGPGGAASGHAVHHRLRTVVSNIGWEEAKRLREVRRLLQEHGVSLRNHVDPAIWVNAVARRATEITGPVVITDVRFPNEADWVVGAGGRLVRVVRPGQESADTHISETALDDRDVHHVAVNCGNVDDLHRRADFIVGLLGPWT